MLCLGVRTAALMNAVRGARADRVERLRMEMAAMIVQKFWKRRDPVTRRRGSLRSIIEAAAMAKLAEAARAKVRRSRADRLRSFLTEAKKLPPFRRCIARLQRAVFLLQRVFRRTLRAVRSPRGRLAGRRRGRDAEIPTGRGAAAAATRKFGRDRLGRVHLEFRQSFDRTTPALRGAQRTGILKAFGSRSARGSKR